MVRLTISPRSDENLYGLLVQKELTLRRMKRGTLHRYGPKRKNEEKWATLRRMDGYDSKTASDTC